MILTAIKKVWEFLNNLSPQTRSLIILLLFGYVLYSQINESTKQFITEQYLQKNNEEKQAEQYAKDTAGEINRHIRLISLKDSDAFNVLLLSYHNSKSSLSGYKFLYLSCIAESPKSVDTPLLKNQWANLNYIYYVDELEKIHNQGILNFNDIDDMSKNFPKLCSLLKYSEAEAASFYTIEGKKMPIGIIVILYKNPINCKMSKAKIVMPSIQKLAILLDYENK